MCCANYIQNKSLHKALDEITPFEAWCGRKPSVKHFKVFGCTAWARIPPQKRKALELQRKLCIFVGYPDNLKAYKLMDLETHKIIYKRSVHFEKNCPILARFTPPSSSFMDSDHSDDSDSEDEIPSTLTHRPPPSHGSQIVEDIPSSSTKPRWAQQTLDSIGSLVRNPSDTRKTRLQHNSFPQAYIAIASDPHSFKEASGIPEWDKAMKGKGRKMV